MRFPQLLRTVVLFRDPLLAHPFLRWCAIVALVLLTAAWIAVLAIPNLPGTDAVVVHYTTTFGIDALGSWRDLLRLPLTGTILLAVNFTIARVLIAPNTSPDMVPTATTVLAIASVIIEFTVLVGCILLWRVNIR
ncbi:MAG: hypothetical protein Q7R80_03835 [bacterium]|nr:hypothetical protein [bacterium]